MAVRYSGGQGSNLRPPGLGPGTLPAELHPDLPVYLSRARRQAQRWRRVGVLVRAVLSRAGQPSGQCEPILRPCHPARGSALYRGQIHPYSVVLAIVGALCCVLRHDLERSRGTRWAVSWRSSQSSVHALYRPTALDLDRLNVDHVRAVALQQIARFAGGGVAAQPPLDVP